MRYFEIAAGLRLHVSSEEWELLSRIEEKPVARNQLDERQRELARLMLSRGLLDHYRKDDEIYYRASSIDDIWRDKE